MRLSTLVSAEQLAGSLDDTRLVLLDARAGSDAARRFSARRLRGARRVDLETDLSGDTSRPERGGRHPLPTLADFASTLGRLGVTPTSRVVVYDESSGALAAARLWWMLREVGHDEVAVLDGGLGASDLPETSGPPEPNDTKSPYPVPDGWALPTVDLEGVAARGPTHALWDVRSEARHRGHEEPIDPVAGHIPGARSTPLTRHLVDGRFIGREALQALYDPLLGGKPVEDLIVSCGSGVTACHTLLALSHAGRPGAALYVGSYSEWCRSGRPIETE